MGFGSATANHDYLLFVYNARTERRIMDVGVSMLRDRYELSFDG